MYANAQSPIHTFDIEIEQPEKDIPYMFTKYIFVQCFTHTQNTTSYAYNNNSQTHIVNNKILKVTQLLALKNNIASAALMCLADGTRISICVVFSLRCAQNTHANANTRIYACIYSREKARQPFNINLHVAI